jgi:hypothetical protein
MVAMLAVANLVGVAAISVGAYQTHQSLTMSDGMAWLVVSLAGLGACGTANALWLMRCRRLIAVALGIALDPRHRVALTPATATAAAQTLVAIPGARRYHRPGCALVADRRVRRVSAPRGTTRLLPCEICQPG